MSSRASLVNWKEVEKVMKSLPPVHDWVKEVQLQTRKEEKNESRILSVSGPDMFGNVGSS